LQITNVRTGNGCNLHADTLFCCALLCELSIAPKQSESGSYVVDMSHVTYRLSSAGDMRYVS
jgi:hypothetical protein